MLGTGQKLKIVNVIVGSVSVNVMDVFIGFQLPAHVILHNKPVFIDTVFNRLGVPGCPHKDVATRATHPAPASPVGVFPASLPRLVPARLAAKSASDARRFVLELTWVYLKRCLAFGARELDARAAAPGVGVLGGLRPLEEGVAVAVAKLTAGFDGLIALSALSVGCHNSAPVLIENEDN